MIGFFRRTAGGWGGKIILGIIAASFVTYGVVEYFARSTASAPVADIDGETLRAEDYVVDFRSRVAMRNLEATRLPPPLVGDELLRVMSDVVLRRALVAEALSLGFEAPDAAIVAAQRSKPYFQGSNQAFSLDIYRQILDSAEISAEQFDAEIRRDETIRVLLRAVVDGVEPPRATTELVWRRLREERDISYLELTPESVAAPDAPDAETLRAYYDADPERFRQPDRRRVRILAILPEDVVDRDAVTSDDARAIYDANIDNFVQPEQRNLQLLIFPDEAAASEAALRIADGARILEIAAEIGMSRDQTNLDYRDRDDFAAINPDLAEAVFAPGVADQSLVGPVALSGGGAALVYVNGIRPGFETPFEDVRDELIDAIALSRARDELSEAEATVEDLIAQSVPLETIAEDRGYRIVETVIDRDGLDETGVPAELPFAAADLPRHVFEARLNFATEAYEADNDGGYYAIEALEEIPSRSPPYEEIEPRVAASWVAAERRRIMRERAETIRDRLVAGEDLETVAVEYALEVQTSDGLTRHRVLADTQSALNEAVFSVSPDSAVGAVVIVEAAGGEARQVARIDALREPADEAYADVADDTRAILELELWTYYIRDVDAERVTDYNPQTAYQALQADQQRRR